MLPVTRANTILYLAIVFTALIVNLPSTITVYDQLTGEEEIAFSALQTKYPKLTFYRYMTIRICCYAYSHKHRVPVEYMCAIAQNESEMNDTSVSSTGDYGFFQINAYHQYRGKNPEDLFNFELNTKLAVNYYSQCYDKMLEVYGPRDLAQSFRFYNAGMSNNIDSYNNWDYVINIMEDIQESQATIKEAIANARLVASL